MGNGNVTDARVQGVRPSSAPSAAELSPDLATCRATALRALGPVSSGDVAAAFASERAPDGRPMASYTAVLGAFVSGTGPATGSAVAAPRIVPALAQGHPGSGIDARWEFGSAHLDARGCTTIGVLAELHPDQP